MFIKNLLNQDASGTNPIKGPWLGIGDFTRASLQLVTDGDLDGEWGFEVSNVDGADAIADPEAAFPVDVTDAWELVDDEVPIKTVDHTDADTQRQYAQTSEINAGYCRAIFRPSSGSGRAIAALTLRRPYAGG